MATIQEVARRAGVSTGTVSRYLNGHQLKQANMERVKQAIADLNYHENYLAKSLRSSKTMSIGLLINNMQNNFASSVVAQIESELELQDYSLMLCGFRNNQELYTKKLNMILERQVDGLILFEGSPHWTSPDIFDAIDIPVIAINTPYNHPHIDSFVTDDFMCTQQVISKMIEYGHTRIGVIAGPQLEHASRERLSGIKMAFEMAGLPQKNLIIRFGDYSRSSGYKTMLHLLDEAGCDCIFVCNYVMSQGALQAVHERALRIGENLSFACFDYFETSALFYPRLTAVFPNTQLIGTLAAKHLLSAIKSKSISTGLTIPVANRINWNPSIVDKRSCAPRI